MYIWLYWENRDEETIPSYIELCHETIRRHCSDNFEVVLTTPETIRDYIPDAGPFEKMENSNPAIRTAYIRVALLEKYGGIWMDSDIIVLKDFAPMQELIQKHEFVGFLKSSSGDNHIPNWMMMSKPGGKVITAYKDALDTAIERTKVFTWGELGAGTVTPIIRSGRYDRFGYILLDEKQVSPIPWQKSVLFFSNDIDPGDIITDQTYSVLLFNKTFSKEFRQTNRKNVLEANSLIAKLFKLSLEI